MTVVPGLRVEAGERRLRVEMYLGLVSDPISRRATARIRMLLAGVAGGGETPIAALELLVAVIIVMMIVVILRRSRRRRHVAGAESPGACQSKWQS